MRAFLIFAVVAGLGGLYFWQKQNESTPAPSPKNGGSSVAVVAATPQPLAPAPRGQASEYNWMKRSLDRAATVRDQARDQTRSAQNP